MNFFVIGFLILNYISTIKCEIDDPERILPKPPDCGVPTGVSKRSYGSEPVNITHFPWMVAMVYSEIENLYEKKVECGGALINKRYVITAAHCVGDSLKSVLVGTTNITDMSKSIKVEKYLKHSKFVEDYGSFSPVQFDIALVRLAEDVTFSHNVHPICLPFQIEDYSPPTLKTKFLLSGWGRKEFVTENNILSVVELPFFDFDACREIYAMYKSYFNSKVLCAGGGIGKDSCFGDSGSPLIRQIGNVWIMDGIVTGSIDAFCGTLNPGAYVNVIKYEEWIKEHVYYNLESGQNTMRTMNVVLLIVCLVFIL